MSQLSAGRRDRGCRGAWRRCLRARSRRPGRKNPGRARPGGRCSATFPRPAAATSSASAALRSSSAAPVRSQPSRYSRSKAKEDQRSVRSLAIASCRSAEIGGAVGFEMHQLAVDHRVLDRQRREPRRQRPEFRGPVEPVAGDEPRLAAADPGEQAIAVIFDLVQPVAARPARLPPRSRAAAAGRRACRPFLALECPPDRPAARGCGRASAGTVPRRSVPRPGRGRRRSRRSCGRSRRFRVVGDDRVAAARHRRLVALLDQEPVVACRGRHGAAAHPHQHPFAVQLFAVEREFERRPWHRPLRGSGSSGFQLPRSHISTVPPPYSPSGMTPSNPPYSSGWSSTWTASRFSPGSRLGPFGTAQLFSTPSSSSRKS